jgi:PTH1 family peptidyl-tRNA hydrolase
LIVGLGNPGTAYDRTRHNAGFMALDRVARRHAPPGSPSKSKFNSLLTEATIAGERCILLKPLTFMNRSGSPVAETLHFYKLAPASDLLVLVDEYALPLGRIRLRASGSDGGHNGLADIERALGSRDYPRLRIGIDPPPQTYDDPADWVLGTFTPDQAKALDPALDRTADAVEVFASLGIEAAMNRFNAEPKPTPPPKPPRPPPLQGQSPPEAPG